MGGGKNATDPGDEVAQSSLAARRRPISPKFADYCGLRIEEGLLPMSLEAVGMAAIEFKFKADHQFTM